jgi:hypothetical protein
MVEGGFLGLMMVHVFNLSFFNIFGIFSFFKNFFNFLKNFFNFIKLF